MNRSLDDYDGVSEESPTGGRRPTEKNGKLVTDGGILEGTTVESGDFESLRRSGSSTPADERPRCPYCGSVYLSPRYPSDLNNPHPESEHRRYRCDNPDCQRRIDDPDRPEIHTDGGRDSPKGDIRVTLERDDINALLDNGTNLIQKDVGPITVNIRTHQKLNAVVTVSGRRKDPEPEVVDE